MNAAAHLVPLGQTGSFELPTELKSGPCRHTIGSGNIQWGVSPVSGGAYVSVSAGITIREGQELSCSFDAWYRTNTAGTALVGGGYVTDCKEFKCTLSGRALSCHDLQQALRRHSCATTTEF